MSTRLGKAKQLLPFGSTTLLGQTLETVRSSQVDDIVVVLGFAADEIRERLSLEGVKTVVNEAYREGIGSSLRRGLENVDHRARAAIVMLGDQPFVESTTINELIEQYRRNRPEVAVPLYRGFRGNPVLLDRSVFPEAMALQGDVGCRALFGSRIRNLLKVPVEDPGILLDVDREGDLERFLDAYGRQQSPLALLAPVELEDRKVATGSTAGRPELVIVGQEPVGRALGKMAKLLDFGVTFVDPWLPGSDVPEAHRLLHVLDLSRLALSPDSQIVVATRGRFDEEALEQAVCSEARYVALVSSRGRAAEVLQRLEAKGLAPEKLKRLRVPAGLAIDARTPAEIALSILAEIVQDRNQRAAGADNRAGT